MCMHHRPTIKYIIVVPWRPQNGPHCSMPKHTNSTHKRREQTQTHTSAQCVCVNISGQWEKKLSQPSKPGHQIHVLLFFCWSLWLFADCGLWNENVVHVLNYSFNSYGNWCDISHIIVCSLSSSSASSSASPAQKDQLETKLKKK